MSCKKRCEGGQWVCNRCGTRWDLDDTNECPHAALDEAFDNVASNLHDDATRNIKDILKNENNGN